MIIGVDEAGRGPALGPLVVAAIRIDDADLPRLKELGVRDSKQLRPARREVLAPALREICDVGLVVVEARDLDRMRSKLTMNQIEEQAFAAAVCQLEISDGTELQLDAADVIADRFGRVVEAHICDYYEQRGLAGPRLRVISQHKADVNWPAVAAASIIAKQHRDHCIALLQSELGEPIGSGYPSDPATKKFLQSWFERHSGPPPGARQSWETIKRFMKQKNQFRLDAYIS